MPRVLVASDPFDSTISASWTNGEADYGTFSHNAGSGGHVRPTNTGDWWDRLRRSTGTYNNDQYSICVGTLGNTSGGGAGVGVFLRGQASATDESSYHFFMINGAYGARYQIAETDSAGSAGGTTLASSGTGSTIADVTIVGEAEGTTLRMFTNEGAGETLRLTTSDATLTSGWPGVAGWGDNSQQNCQITSWEGGNITSAATSLPIPRSLPAALLQM